MHILRIEVYFTYTSVLHVHIQVYFTQVYFTYIYKCISPGATSVFHVHIQVYFTYIYKCISHIPVYFTYIYKCISCIQVYNTKGFSLTTFANEGQVEVTVQGPHLPVDEGGAPRQHIIVLHPHRIGAPEVLRLLLPQPQLKK